MELNPRDEAQKIFDKIWSNRSFPVDPITIGKILGLNILETELPDTVSAALIKEAGKDPKIALHKTDHSNRKRFSCAHELGHYIYRIESADDAVEYEYICLRGLSASRGTENEEIFANQFAAHLLMPNSTIKELVGAGKKIFEMALFFGVSAEALKHKLNFMGLLL